jgi:hypothetical protein
VGRIGKPKLSSGIRLTVAVSTGQLLCSPFRNEVKQDTIFKTSFLFFQHEIKEPLPLLVLRVCSAYIPRRREDRMQSDQIVRARGDG